MKCSCIPEKDYKAIELDPRYSTTRCVSTLKPELNSNRKLIWESDNIRLIHGGLRCQGYFKHSNPEEVLISVVTIVYNGDKYIEQTIQSIVNQTYSNVEYIIVDGGSSDGTIDILRHHQDKIDYWISEPDRGIADAMNKAVELASGMYVVFIHADDYLYSDHVFKELLSDISCSNDIIMFKVLFGKNLKPNVPKKFNWWVNFKIPGCHQGIFCKLSLFHNVGFFDTRFKINMDYDFLLRAYRKGVIVERQNSVLSVMRDTGISSRKDWTGLKERFVEEYYVHKKNCSSVLIIFYWIYWSLYAPYRMMKYLISA